MSVVVMSRVWEKSPQKGSNLLLTLALADSANHSGVGYAGIAYLKDRIRMSERNTERLMDSLEQSGEIFRRKGNGRGVKTYFAVLTSLDQNAIAKVLEEHAEQFQLTSDEIETHAKSIIEKRRNFAALKKSAKKSPIKRGNSRNSKAEKVTKSSKKGDKSIREKSGDQPHGDTPNPATPEPRSVDPLNTDVSKDTSTQPANAVASDPPKSDTPSNPGLDPLPASQVLTTDKNLPPGVASDKLYLVLPENTFEGPYAPTGTFVKATTGAFMQGEAIPPGAKIIPPAHVRAFEAVKALLDAIGREKLPPGVDEKQFMDLGKKWAKANVDTACLGALIRAWLNANKVAPPLAWTVGEITVFTRYAWGMCQNGITEADVTGYVQDTYATKDPNGRQFWKDKAIPFDNVSKNVGIWKAGKVKEQAKWTYNAATGWKEPTNAK